MSIEDPFDQDDWDTYAKLTSEIGAKVQIVGDDLLVTNPKVIDACFNNIMIDTYHEDDIKSSLSSIG